MKHAVQALCMLIALLTVASAQSHHSKMSFTYPDNKARVRSGSGALFAVYKPEITAPNSGRSYVFSIIDSRGTPLAQHDFHRSVEGAWSQYSDQIFLNDFMGSTQIDCLVWNPGEKVFTSLTDTLVRDPNSGPIEGQGQKPPETPQNSRYELMCTNWIAKNQVSVRPEGTTWAGGQFVYRLVYDVRLRKFRWK